MISFADRPFQQPRRRVSVNITTSQTLKHEAYPKIYIRLDVDDEFWENEDPALCFVQPAGVPCQISSFISLIRLYKIVGYCLRTVVSNPSIIRSRSCLQFFV